jgi:hypothetical protein
MTWAQPISSQRSAWISLKYLRLLSQYERSIPKIHVRVL